VLEQRFADLQDKYAGKAIPAPDFWGGYRLTPSLIEFWQGGAHRLHDRFVYTRDESSDDIWTIQRLSP